MKTGTMCVLLLAAVGWSTSHARAEIKVGDPTPAVAAKDQSGQTIHLKDYHGKKFVVLYFYPKDFTGGCTLEAQKFAEDYPKFTGRDAVVIGISKDSEKSHQEFCGKYELPFTLLSDPNDNVAKAFGVGQEYGRRSTFLIDKAGKVIHVIGKVTDIPGQNKVLLAKIDEAGAHPDVASQPVGPATTPATRPAH